MKLTDVFSTFKSLPANDEDDRYRWITQSCHDRDIANYEDDHVKLIRLWLRACTEIQWVRAYEHGNNNNVNPDYPDGQFGTVFFLRAEETDYTNYIKYEHTPSGDYCQKSIVPLRYIYRLNVLRDAGEANNQQVQPEIQHPIGSAPDPFMHLRARLELPLFRQALKEYCFFLEDSPLRILPQPPQERHSRYEWNAAGELSVITTVTGSVRVPGIDTIELDYCKHDQLE